VSHRHAVSLPNASMATVETLIGLSYFPMMVVRRNVISRPKLTLVALRCYSCHRSEVTSFLGMLSPDHVAMEWGTAKLRIGFVRRMFGRVRTCRSLRRFWKGDNHSAGPDGEGDADAAHATLQLCLRGNWKQPTHRELMLQLWLHEEE
jgi:hypothetical protein